MMCPHCHELLIAFELEGIEIDHCLTCGGTWLDAGELELLTELDGSKSGELSRHLKEGTTSTRGERRCPRCRRRLAIIQVGGPTELDRCPVGHGLWLDRGELQAIMAAYREEHQRQEGAIARFFSEIYKNEFTVLSGESPSSEDSSRRFTS